MNEVYEEDFVNSRVPNNPEIIAYTLGKIEEGHPKEDGWTIGEPEITPNPDGKTVTIKIHLTRDNLFEREGMRR